MERSDKASQGDRFVFAVFLSICAHALVILGIGFSLAAEGRNEAPINIAIASYRGEEPPQADPANADLAGESGTEVATDDISLAIAGLRAQLDNRRQAYAERPRTYTLSSAATRESRDAEYLDNWRRRVEAVGNRNYPAEAERRRIYGSLRLLVSQMPDGSVHDVEILSSSGHELLDRSAVDIVHMAAPFAPFPAEMRSEVDILEIIRTWRFHEAEGLTSH